MIAPTRKAKRPAATGRRARTKQDTTQIGAAPLYTKAAAKPIEKQAIHDRAAADPEGTYRLAGYPGELKRSGHNLTGPCPFHADRDPSFAVALTGDHAGTFKCFGCGAGGDVIAFHQRLHQVPFPESLARLGELLKATTAGPIRPAPSSRPAAPPPPDPEPIPAEVAEECHRRLLESPKALAYLRESKGLPEWVACSANLGLSKDHWRETRFTIPIPYMDGREGYRDIRGYRPGGDPKMLPWSTGRGGTVFPWPWVCRGTRLVWCEGELDALNMIGRGLFACTATNGVQGATSAGLVLPDLRGKEVFVIGDHDPAGEQLAEKLPPRLYAAGAKQVTVLRWPDTGPDGRDLPRGFDLSDWCAAGATEADAWRLVFGHDQ